MYVQAPEQKGNNQMKCQKPKNGGNYLFQPCFYLTVLSTTSYMSSPPEAAQPSCKIPKTPRWPQGLTHIVSC